MMKTKLIAFAAVAAFSAGAAWASPQFKAGTYQARAAGIHGDVVVEATFQRTASKP